MPKMKKLTGEPEPSTWGDALFVGSILATIAVFGFLFASHTGKAKGPCRAPIVTIKQGPQQ